MHYIWSEKEKERQDAIAAGKVPPSEKRRKKNEENKNKQKQQNAHGASGQPLTTGQAVASAVLRKVCYNNFFVLASNIFFFS